MPVTVVPEGLEQVNELLAMLQKIGSTVNGAQLRSVPRRETDATNAEILRWLAEGMRDFVSPTSELLDKVAAAFASTVQARMDAFARTRTAKKLGVTDVQQYAALGRIGIVDQEKVEKKAREIASTALREALYVWMDDVVRRIEAQSSVDGKWRDLTYAYAVHKLHDFGFMTPIGKASGQLLDNLDSSGTGARNVRITKDAKISVADEISKSTRSFIKSNLR